MKAVIDTNILVSAFWKPSGNTYLIFSNLISGKIIPCFDSRIMNEYRDVLMRPEFNFPSAKVNALLNAFVCYGISVVPAPIPVADVKDEDDRAFYEVAKFCNAPLVTGNLKHFPSDPLVMNPANFCSLYLDG